MTPQGVRLAAYYGPVSALTNHAFTATCQHGSIQLFELASAAGFEGASGVGTYTSTTTFSAPPATETRTLALRFVLEWGFASSDGGTTAVDGSPYAITSGGTLLQSQPGLIGDGFTLLASVPDTATAAVAGSAAKPMTYLAYVAVNCYTATLSQGGTPSSAGPGPAAYGTMASVDFSSGHGRFRQWLSVGREHRRVVRQQFQLVH